MDVKIKAVWRAAHEVVRQAPEVIISGATGISAGDVNGTYTYMPDTDPEEAPVFRKKAWMVPSWLYLSADNEWWISFTEKKERRESIGYLFSAAVEPGTLPSSAAPWKIAVGGDYWEKQEGLKIDGPTCTAAQARARATVTPDIGDLLAKDSDYAVSIKLDPEAFVKYREELMRFRATAAVEVTLGAEPKKLVDLLAEADSRAKRGEERAQLAEEATTAERKLRGAVEEQVVVEARQRAASEQRISDERSIRSDLEAQLAAEVQKAKEVSACVASREQSLSAERARTIAAEGRCQVEDRRRIAAEEALRAAEELVVSLRAALVAKAS